MDMKGRAKGWFGGAESAILIDFSRVQWTWLMKVQILEMKVPKATNRPQLIASMPRLE